MFVCQYIYTYILTSPLDDTVRVGVQHTTMIDVQTYPYKWAYTFYCGTCTCRSFFLLVRVRG